MRDYGDECDRCERTLPERGPQAVGEAFATPKGATPVHKPDSLDGRPSEPSPRSESVYARWQRVHGDTDHDDACGWADGSWDDGER